VLDFDGRRILLDFSLMVLGDLFVYGGPADDARDLGAGEWRAGRGAVACVVA
jgi:hypothetical protein